MAAQPTGPKFNNVHRKGGDTVSKWIISVAIGLVAALVVGILGINLVSPFVTTILGLNTTAWPAGLGAMVYVLNYVFVGGLAIVMVQMFLGKVMEQD